MQFLKTREVAKIFGCTQRNVALMVKAGKLKPVNNHKDFFLFVSQDLFSFNEGRATNPTLTLYLDHHETCWQLLMGTRDGMDAFMNGQYRADGNIVLSQLLLYLFKSSDPAVAFKVQD